MVKDGSLRRKGLFSWMCSHYSSGLGFICEDQLWAQGLPWPVKTQWGAFLNSSEDTCSQGQGWHISLFLLFFVLWWPGWCLTQKRASINICWTKITWREKKKSLEKRENNWRIGSQRCRRSCLEHRRLGLISGGGRNLFLWGTAGQENLCKNKRILSIKKTKWGLFNSLGISFSCGSGSRRKDFRGNDKNAILKASVGKYLWGGTPLWRS